VQSCSRSPALTWWFRAIVAVLAHDVARTIRGQTTAMAHECRFRGLRDMSALPPTPESLRHCNEPTLRTTSGLMQPNMWGEREDLIRHEVSQFDKSDAEALPAFLGG
jgi:hypothetical protein